LVKKKRAAKGLAISGFFVVMIAIRQIKYQNNQSITVTQQNCIAAALQLGFSSNASSRADATYAAILGCFS
jgi:hypothetical protein